MDRIETRTQLIEYICEHINRPAIRRACHEGKVFVAGGFSQIPPSLKPGWIAVVTSRFGRIWNIAVTPNEEKRVFDVWEVKTKIIPWQNYIGKADAECSIYGGDNPTLAMQLCLFAITATSLPELAALMCEECRSSATKPDAATDTADEDQTGDPQL